MPQPLDGEPTTRTGHLVIIGGAEDKLRQKQILSRFVALAGGQAARLAVISTASSLGDSATELYVRLFHQMGVAEVTGMRPLTREEANDPKLAETIGESSGIFMTGGNQLRLSSVISGTALGSAIVERYHGGAVVGGTSAGASAISTHMVSFGTSGTTPKQRMTQLSAGLALLPGVVIDQHFEQRNRVGRLLALVSQSPSLLGIGLDEDTAVVVSPGGIIEVVGKGSVMILDASHVQTDAYEVKRHRPIMVSGVIMHSLPSGYRFNLADRVLLPPLRPVSSTDRELAALRSAGEANNRLIRQIAAEGADDRSVERSRRRAARAGGATR